VSEDIHDVVSLYAYQRQLTLVEATYRLLKLGIIWEYQLPIPNDEVDKYEIKKPSALDFRRWFRRR
jgi:hypothetical protein